MSNVKCQKRGFALATTLVLLAVALIGMGGLLTISRIEARISRSQKEGVQAYYVAEAGAQRAIWEIKNDPELLNHLDEGTLNESFNYQNQIANLRDIEIVVASIEPGRAEIVATGKVREDRFPAQRIVKVEIFRGATESALGNIGLYSRSDSDFYGSDNFTVQNGDIYAGNNEMFTSAGATIGGQILAINDYTAQNSRIISQGIQAANYPPAPAVVDMAGVDFDGLRAAANTYYTNNQFKQLIRAGGTIELPGPITFVEGGINIATGQLQQGQRTLNLIVHGLLVVSGNFHFLTPSAPGPWDLDFQVLDDTGGASGIIVSNNVIISGRDNPMSIDGVLYASRAIRFVDTGSLTINGGIIGGSFNDNTSDNVNLTVDPVKIGEVIGFIGGNEPSTLQINHWEEEY